jgi:predicted transcriptional regulator
MLAYDQPEDSEDAADAEAMADVEAGRIISHAAMRDWISSWGAAEERPIPQVGE